MHDFLGQVIHQIGLHCSMQLDFAIEKNLILNFVNILQESILLHTLQISFLDNPL